MARTVAKDHDAKRLHILKTAARAFAEAGIARASMAHIATACGISKANIYHYYDSKNALLFDILDTYLSELRDVLCIRHPSQSPEQQLHAFTRAALLAYDGMDAEHKIQTEGLPLLPDDQQQILKSYQRDMVASLTGILRGLAPATLDQDPAKCHATAMSIFGMLNWFYMWNPDADTATREDYATLVAGIAVSGVSGL